MMRVALPWGVQASLKYKREGKRDKGERSVLQNETVDAEVERPVHI